MIGWLDAQAGVSGDMLLGALVDSGVSLSILSGAVRELGLGIVLEEASCDRGGIGATKVDVVVAENRVVRHLPEIVELLQQLTDCRVRHLAVQAFHAIAEAESRVHRIDLNVVHFHEVGALDTIADVVGVCAGFVELGLDELHCSPVSLGSGTGRGAHGPIPLPGPAVLQILRGVPTRAGAAQRESATPTGAALLKTLVTQWGSLPPMRVDAVGVGAGTAETAEVANVLRLVVGHADEIASGSVVLESNVDDLDPRLWPHVLDLLLLAGAHDAWLTPILMKKGRPAHTLSVLCSESAVPALRAVVYRETSTIGIREQTVTRKHSLDRSETVVHVDGHPIRVKHAALAGEVMNVNPEWRDVQAAALALGSPAKQVLARARAAALEPGAQSANPHGEKNEQQHEHPHRGHRH